MMISIEQIKAARALLNWNQQDLADRAAMSKTALANIERGSASPRMESLAAIQKALEDDGIEFVDGPGVRLRRDVLQVEVLKGLDSVLRLWSDIYQVLKPGEERLISGVDEAKFAATMGKKFDAMMQKYVEKGIKGRILSLEGDRNFMDPSSEYRWVDESRYHDVPYFVYADKYAMLLWEPSPRVILIENKAIADNYRKQFNRHWEEAKRP